MMSMPTLDEYLTLYSGGNVPPLVLPVAARKIGGSYQADGVVVAVFDTMEGQTRVVFEFLEPRGMLHIFNPTQIELRLGKS